MADECVAVARIPLVGDAKERLLVPVTIEGMASQLVFTAASASAINSADADRLGLSHVSLPKGIGLSVNGTRVPEDRGGSLAIGGAVWDGFPFEPTFDMTSSAIASREVRQRSEETNFSETLRQFSFVPNVGSSNFPGVIGSLGTDFIENFAFDLWLDVSGGTMSVYRSGTCTPEQVFASTTYAHVPYNVDMRGLSFPITLDGAQMVGVLSPSLEHSMMPLGAAKLKLAFDDRSPRVVPITPEPGSDVVTYRHTFESLRVGDVSLGTPTLDLVEFAPNSEVASKAQRRGFPNLPNDVVWLGTPELRNVRLFIRCTGDLYVGSATPR